MTLKKDLAAVTAYKATFSTPHGKRVLNDLIEQSGFLRSSYVEGDPYGTVYNEGTRGLVLYILAKLKLKPSQVEEFYNDNITYTEEEL